jgi:hypothetical protein
MFIGSYPGRIIRRFEDAETAPQCYGFNCDCEKPAVVEIQGETDSFGYESECFCEECYQALLQCKEEHEESILEEEHDIAPDGMLWLFTADRQDGADWYCESNKDRAKCVLYQDWAEENSASCGGLYEPKIELVPEDKALRVEKNFRHRWDEEEEDLYDQDWEEDWGDGRYDDDDDDVGWLDDDDNR